jgi:hypothetical protein
MRSLSIVLLGITAALLSGCSTTKKPNYHQAFEFDIGQAHASLEILKSLDAGNTDRVRKLAMLLVCDDMDFARFCGVHGLGPLTPDERQEWIKTAKQTLDYMRRHPDECDLRLASVQAGMRGLRYFLTDPADVHQLDELLEQLNRMEKKRLDTKKP